MTDTPGRRLRSDAARNVDRILCAAREVYASEGPAAGMELVAQRAGVGERTLYRHFPSKGDLVRAALDQSIEENLAPVIAEAVRADDPLTGLTTLIEAAIALGAQEHHLLAAARKAGALANVSTTLDEALRHLVSRAQEDGSVRDDVVADDLPRIVAMLNSVLWTMDPASGGWRRYVALLLDGITVTDGRLLPPPTALRYDASGDWPL